MRAKNFAHFQATKTQNKRWGVTTKISQQQNDRIKGIYFPLAAYYYVFENGNVNFSRLNSNGILSLVLLAPVVNVSQWSRETQF
ncbi:hypothetical protein CEXT_73941 [Caerostris extrusa]|uniref:Uncharacterized protein n=1 Tax=Caerostris extrusa TaxID=172846 RepID=A0AAV4N5V9_CAEEX|nr:hypothetical protein CEXT_73941 [Caerostris extrusa]